jgi:hypothetical protein
VIELPDDSSEDSMPVKRRALPADDNRVVGHDCGGRAVDSSRLCRSRDRSHHGREFGAGLSFGPLLGVITLLLVGITGWQQQRKRRG